MRFKASMIRPMVASSGESPSSSPQAVRTAGATWATTILSGSSMASQTFFRIVPGSQCPHRAVGDALAAERAVRLLDGLSAGNIDGHPGTGPSTVQIPSPWTFHRSGHSAYI